MRRTIFRRVSACGVLLLLLLAILLLPAQADTPILKASDLDIERCQSFADRTPSPAPADAVLSSLGLAKREGPKWSAGRVPGDKPATFRHLLCFRREQSIGSVFLRGAFEVRVHKAGAGYPPDAFNPRDWTLLTPLPHQSGGTLISLPATTSTRALLLTSPEIRPGGASEPITLRLFKNRLHNVTPAALAYANSEYLPPQTSFIPNPASNIPTGRGPWVNVGKDDKGLIPAPPVSEIHPSWFLLAWQQEQTLSGLWLDSNVLKLEVETFDGPATVNPRAGTAAEWRKVRALKETVEKDNTRWLTFPQPIRTRGLKLTFLKTTDGPIATVKGLHAFSDLGERPVPPPPVSAAEPPPFRLPYQIKEDGNLTLVVNTAEGRRVRNVITRAATAKGNHEIAWDLKDEAGNIVEPGKYRWTAVNGPDLRLRYEMTVYPDVSRHAPENSPWQNAHHDSGGWMADHTPPCSGCTAGDRVYLGSYVAESGVSLIECDLEGRKKWGHHSFAAWTGPRFLASDGKEVFVGATILGSTTDSVWGVDVKTKKVREVLSLKPTANRKRGLTGLAARDGKLYLSVRAGESWMESAAAAEDADLANCVPIYQEQRKPRVNDEPVPNPRFDFLRLFRLTSYPPGGGRHRSLEYLETESGKGAKKHIVLSFQRPVPLGSVVYPALQDKAVKVTLSVLKPGAGYPPNADRESDWTPFASSGSAPWEAVPAPENTRTRALRITFARGSVERDPLADLIDKPKVPGDPDKKDPKDLLDFGKDHTSWKGRLEGMKLLRRRYVNVTPSATIRVNSGKVAGDGSWDAQRSAMLTETDPGIYVLEWKEPQSLRGLAIKEIDGELTRIDVHSGNGPIDVKGRENWQEVAKYEQQRRDVANGYGGLGGITNPTARYVDGYVDFGKEVRTRAVRLRVVKQWADKGQSGCLGIRMDLGGGTIDPKRCRVWGVAALKYVGGEAPVDTAAVERIETYDVSTGKQVQEVPLDRPDVLAFNPAGELHVLSGKRILRVGAAAGQHRMVVDDLVNPSAFTFDSRGQLFVFDAGQARNTVRVYEAAGKYLRSIGTPGGFKVGPWVPTRLGSVAALMVDAKDQLWMVEGQYHPKRITVWTTEGKFVKELLGNTPYGGGGVLDPLDKTRLFYGPMEFELDWKTGLSRIKNLLWTGSTQAGEVPIHLNGRTYLVTRPQFSEMPVGIVYLHEKDRLKMVAAVGQADAFEPLKQPDVQAKLGGKPMTEYRFLWTDHNGDGEVQAEEVTLSPRADMHGLTGFNRDLGIQSGTRRFQVKEFLANGAPVFEEKEFPGLKGRTIYRLSDGNFFRMGMGADPQALLAPDGKPIWTFPHEGEGVQALHHAKPWRPDQVVAQFGIVGQETVHAGGLGEVVVIHGNSGAWNVWTRDGLLVGPIFRDMRAPGARPWSMKEHERGPMPEGLTAGEEHFAGYFCRSAKDDKYYVVAGHNHISVLEVLGLEKYERLGGEITITAEDVRKAREWDGRRQKEDVYARSPVLDVYRVRQVPAFDGKLGGWGQPAANLPEGPGFWMGYDDRYLYLAWYVRGLGPLNNTGQDWQRLFKTGAAVDLHIGIDPAAKADRQAPEAGDARLLLTFMGKKPTAVLYRPVVPGTPADKAWKVRSPVGETIIDRVDLLQGVRLVRGGYPGEYNLEAAVPLSALGLKPSPGLRLKLDWGVLVSGPDGTEVLRRIYWANRANQIVADAPSEARLHPHLWGHAVFHGVRPSADDKLTEIDKGPPKDVKDVTDILDDLKNRPPRKP